MPVVVEHSQPTRTIASRRDLRLPGASTGSALSPSTRASTNAVIFFDRLSELEKVHALTSLKVNTLHDVARSRLRSATVQRPTRDTGQADDSSPKQVEENPCCLDQSL